MALKRRKEKQSGGKPAKKKTPIKNVEEIEENFSGSDDEFNGTDHEFDDMEDIPFETTSALPLKEAATENYKDENNQVRISEKNKKRKDYYKPPTSQELNALRETENLFHSNLFKLQIEEMLTELTFKPKRRQEIEEWISKFCDELLKIPETKPHSLTETAWLEKYQVKCPFQSDIYDGNQKFKFLKPQKIATIGSWAANVAGKGCSVDLLVEIPKECLERDDYLNYRYHRKRALYLAYVAGHFKKASYLVQEVHFEAQACDRSRPIVVIEPSGKLNQKVIFRVFVAASPEFTAMEKLLPHLNCVPGSKTAKSAEAKATPLYNTSILADMRMAKLNQHAAEVLANMKNIQEACILLKVWHRHRQLEDAFGMFTLTQFVVHLVETKKLFPNMSIYQILRTVWLQISRSDWTKEGITLRQTGQGLLSVADAHASFSVVFLDTTSSFNLCAYVSKSAYEWFRWECSLAVGLLNKRNFNSFSALFMTPKPFLLTFENVVNIEEVQSLVSEDTDEKHWPVVAQEKIHQCLLKGLGRRLKLVAARLVKSTSWPIKEVSPKSKWSVAIGFAFNTPDAWDVLDKGPAADDPAAKEFRTFWGAKSELRRFQDGFVCEAVHWPAKNWAERRLICRQIICHLLDKHLKLANKYNYIANQLDGLLSIPKLEDPATYGTGEESSLAALEALDDFGKKVRNLDDLTLPITQVQGVAATFRHAEPFPALPQIPQGSYKLLGRHRDNLLPSAEMTPIYRPSMTVLLSLQVSGKWPDDLEAVRRVKAAFYIELGEKLRQNFDLPCQVSVDHLIAEFNGYVFKLVIAYHRDTTLLKRMVDANGLVKYRDNPESIRLERDHEVLPKLSTALRGLQAEQPAFSTAVRLAKRWIASHMLLDYMEEEAVELIVASMFVDSAMYGVPSTVEQSAQQSPKFDIDFSGSLNPQVGFLRFLQLVAYHDWATQPLVINFNSGLSHEEIRDIDSAVSAQRSQYSSPVVLVTPFDPSGVAFTRHSPPVPVWSRLMLLSRESLKVLEQQLSVANPKPSVDVCQVFRPPIDSYDCIIRLKKGAIARRLYTLDARSDKKLKKFESDTRTRKSVPVFDYEPVDRLLNELRSSYGDKARFFYDTYGGTFIGVMWVDKAWASPSEFKVSHVNGSSLVAPATAQGEPRLAPNLDAICNDFLIMGRGLVCSVQSGSLLLEEDAQ